MRTSLSSLNNNNSNWVMSNVTGAVTLYSSSNNLGIGLSNPVYPVDVNGGLRMSSNLFCQGFSNVGANTYASSLQVSGNARLNGALTGAGGTYGSGFSNTVAGGATYTSVLSNVGTISAPGFSNVAGGGTYVATLACAGNTLIGGRLTASNGLLGSGFSNTAAGCTYVSVLSNSGTASLAGATTFVGALNASNGIYCQGFSNVAGVTYTSTLSNAGDVVCGGNVSAGNIGMFRNRIINGDMRFNQRYAGNPATVTNGASYILDRWNAWVSTTNVSLAVQRVAASVSGSTLLGFQYACQLSPTAATTTLASGDLAVVGQVIEGTNISDLGWGTSAALSVVVSFWVYCNASGTYSVNLVGQYPGGSGASVPSLAVPFSVTSGGWQRVVMTIPGPTTGTWTMGNTGGVLVRIVLAAGSTYFIASNGAWLTNTNSNVAPSGQTNFFASLVNKMWITGFQFEKGTNNNATPFEFRSYATELQLCQRYYEKSYEVDTVPGTVTQVGCFHTRVHYASYGNAFVYPQVSFKVTKIAPPIAPNLLVYDAITGGTVDKWHVNSVALTPITPLTTYVDPISCSSSSFYTYANYTTWVSGVGVWFQWACSCEL